MKIRMHRLLISMLPLAMMLIACMSFVSISAQVPVLNSYSAASATIYLDFDGQFIEGTIWNQRGPINANASGLSPDVIKEIFSRIADDYHPFNINITTDESVYEKAPVSQRARIIFTSTSNWYGNATGASCVGSFVWGDETPAWVFSSLLGNNPKFIAACASHQIGHTLGLQHQSVYDVNCGKITEYNGGVGTMENGWAPIMGIAYYKSCTVWQTGPSTVGCDSVQSDADIIAGPRNHIGFRTDDYGDDYTKANPVLMSGQSFALKGMINHLGDKDAFSIHINSRAELQLRLVPDMTQKKYGRLNIQVTLLNERGEAMVRYDAIKLTYTGIDLLLDPGTYYFIVEDNNFRKPLFYAMSGSLTGAEHIKQLASNH